MLDGEEDHLLQLFLCLLKTTNILPFNVRDLDVSFSERCRIDASHSEFEVLLSNSHGFEDLSVNLLSLDVDDVHLLSNALKGRFST